MKDDAKLLVQPGEKNGTKKSTFITSTKYLGEEQPGRPYKNTIKMEFNILETLLSKERINPLSDS
ncbi:MAG: hypothetical protein ACJAY8_001549 [Sphingobacteriales bacterium]|jgi:hypothetical protein